MSWDPATDKNVDHYNIWFSEKGDWGIGKRQKAEVSPSREETYAYIGPVVAGKTYSILIQSINVWGYGSEAVYATHTVVGKSAKPGDPTGVTLAAIEGGVEVSWTNPADKDLKYIEVFADTTSPTDPDDLQNKIPSGAPGALQKYVIPVTPGETRYVKIKAVDGSDNASNLVASSPASATATSAPFSGGVADSIVGQGDLATQNTADYATDISGTKPPSDADKTSLNTAAGIAGQGALATLDSADFATQVSGTKPPADADKTQSAIESGVTPTTGSIITGDKINLDFTNGRVMINSTTWATQGVQIEYNGGIPRAYVGNGGDRYFMFDGSDVKLGAETQLIGADAYNNDGVYWHTFFDSLEAFSINNNSSQSRGPDGTYVTYVVGDGTAQVSRSLLPASGYFQFYKELTNPVNSLSWDNNRRFKATLKYSVGGSSADTRSYLTVGDISGKYAGFLVKNTNQLYSSSYGTSGADVSLGITLTNNQVIKLEVVIDAGTSIKYYVDGVLKHTQTTASKIPTGSADSRILNVDFRNDNVSSSQSPGFFRFTEYVFLQE